MVACPFAFVGGGVGFESGPKYIILEILKTVSSALFDTDSSGKCLSPQKGATHYYAQLGVSNKGREIKGLIVCWTLLSQYPWMIEQRVRFN